MKTIFLTTLILAMLGMSMYALIPHNSTPTSIEISVLRDITEAHTAKPEADKILPLFEMEQVWNGAIFRYINLSDVSINDIQKAHIKTADEWTSNAIKRKKEITQFTTDVSNIISNTETEIIGKQGSSIYLAMVNELTHISKSTSDKRILLVYSDLMEHNNEFSFYDQKYLHLMKTNPKSLADTLQAYATIPMLSNLEVYFIFQPQNTKQDQNFHLVSQFYKSLLESKGAHVYIIPNL